MGQKIHPFGFRLGVIKNWRSRWVAPFEKYPEYIIQDEKIRKLVNAHYGHAGISSVEIERLGNKMRVIIWTAKPGMIIGRQGSEIEKLREEVTKLLKNEYEVRIAIYEVKNPEVDAQIVSDSIARQIEHRVSYKRAMKQAIMRAVRAGAQGIKLAVSGRLGGAEIARREWFVQGKLPLSTLKSDVDYGYSIAVTKYGTIGVKSWIYKGDVEDTTELLPPRGIDPAERRPGKHANA
ncbi:30S ribosomal protein S3 [Coprothermobacteraceae bacterium]|nr:30S ribosomal protein S3 [Coprothermobacteraceae bacterium]